MFICNIRGYSVGDYVKVINEPFKDYYATVIGSSYGGEIEIQYFQKFAKYWKLRKNDFDSREPVDLQLIHTDQVAFTWKGEVSFKS